MPDTSTATGPVGEREHPDKSPQAVQDAAVEAKARTGRKPGQRAEVSNLEIVRHYFDLAADRLKLADDLRVVFWTPYREVTVQIPIKQSDGKVHVYSGYRIQHNGARGPYKGGVRFHPEVDIDEVRRPRFAHDLEDRGGRRPLRRREGRHQLSRATELERSELQAITRSFMDKVEKVLGPTRDIPAPDVNTNAQVMAWMMDEYGKLHGHTPAICTGKPIALEGSYGREAATGRGCVYMFREAAPQPRPLPRRHHLRRPGLRQRGLVGGPDHAAARRHDGRRLGRSRRDPQRRRDRRERAPRPPDGGRRHHRVPRAPRRSTRTT